MTSIARILDRWTMSLDDPTPGEPWFLDWVVKSPNEVGHHLTAGWLALQSLGDLRIDTCREYFGGMGAQALMVEELFNPDHHVVMDASEQAADHLWRVLPDHVETFAADAYDPASAERADLVMLDFGDLTAYKLRPDQPHGHLLDRVAALSPSAVVITDTAGHFLHLHQATYSRIIGPCGTYDIYLESLSRKLEERMDLTLVAGYSRRWSTVMSFVPAGLGVKRGKITRTPDLPVGLELV